jgi:hypothetical protein
MFTAWFLIKHRENFILPFFYQLKYNLIYNLFLLLLRRRLGLLKDDEHKTGQWTHAGGCTLPLRPVNFYQTTRRHILQDGTLHSHRCGNLKYKAQEIYALRNNFCDSAFFILPSHLRKMCTDNKMSRFSTVFVRNIFSLREIFIFSLGVTCENTSKLAHSLQLFVVNAPKPQYLDVFQTTKKN